MKFGTTLVAFISAAFLAVATPVDTEASDVETLVKREVSYGNPDLVVDQGNRFKVNYGSTGGHDNACPGHYICYERSFSCSYIGRNGGAHGDVSLGNPDDFVDEGNRWRLNYGSTGGHDNACPGHYM